MDRTVIAPWKAEEKELGEKLYQKLHGLFLLHPCTEEFRKVCTDDMFLKPNQAAFFQVMNYLFRLLDGAEFKKRFYWPITDKKAEANFRSSTVEYLKHISEKHQLNWNIKSYLVVMPGGMKFITFLLDLVSFVVLELTRKREKELAAYIEGGQALNLNLKRMQRQNAFYKQYASAYLTEADVVIEKLTTKTQMLEKALTEMAEKTGVSRYLLEDDEFVKKYSEENEQLFQTKIGDRCAQVATLGEHVMQMKTAFEECRSVHAETKLDSGEVRRALRSVAEHFDVPELENDIFATPCSGDYIKMNSLLLAFNSICKYLEGLYEAVEQTPRTSEFVKGEWGRLKKEVLFSESQITEFKKMLNANQKNRDTERNLQQFQTPTRGGVTVTGPEEGGIDVPQKARHRENALMRKFVSTPPIKWESMEGNRTGNTRLPLLDDYSAKSGDTTYNSFLAPPRSARKTKLANTTLNTTMQKSKIIDPMQLLRTINKDKSKLRTTAGQLNLSGLGAKWKERQNMFGNEPESDHRPPRLTPAKSPRVKENLNYSGTVVGDRSLIATPTTSRTALTLSPFNTNEKTSIARSQYNLYAGGANASETSLVFGKRLSAVKKVQDASLNFQNLSTSPSGRLDPLVPPDIPKLKVNDTTLNTSAGISLDIGDTGMDTENNPNLVNIQDSFKFNLSIGSDEDDLFSVSDSVLNDLIM